MKLEITYSSSKASISSTKLLQEKARQSVARSFADTTTVDASSTKSKRPSKAIPKKACAPLKSGRNRKSVKPVTKLRTRTAAPSNLSSRQLSSQIRKESKKLLDAELQAERIGVWDITNSLGFLPDLLDQLNDGQSVFRFFWIDAAVPIDLVSQPSKVEEWISKHEKLRSKEVAQVQQNLIAPHFYETVEPIRTKLDLHVLIGIVPSMVADIVNDEVWWNLFYTWNNNVAVVSTADLFQFAQDAERTPEFAAAILLVTALIQERLNIELVHEETRNCIFDLNWDRKELKQCLKTPKIDDFCLEKLERYHDVALTLLNVLDVYKGPKTVKKKTNAKSRSKTKATIKSSPGSTSKKKVVRLPSKK